MVDSPRPDPEVLLAHAAFVRELASALLHGDSRSEDVAQDALVVALRRGPRHPGFLRAWLAGVVRNLVFTIRRRDAARLRREHSAARTIELPKNEQKISQAELFAMAIATIQAKRFIRQVPPVVEYGIWAGLAAIGTWLMRSRRRGRLAMLWLVLLILYIVAGMMLFQYTGRWAPLMVPVGIMACILVVGLLLPMMKAERGAEEGAGDAG